MKVEWITLFLLNYLLVEQCLAKYDTKILTSCSDLGAHQVITIQEDVPIGTVIIRINGGTGKGFRLDSDTTPAGYIKTAVQGNVTATATLNKALDYEALRSSNYIVLVVFSCDDSRYEVRLSVGNVVEGNLTFSRSQYNKAVLEDAPVGTTVLKDILVDVSDVGYNGLTAPFKPLSDYFSTRNVGPGRYVIILAKKLDYAVQQRYSLTVEASVSVASLNTTKTATATVIIDVKDVDNLSPVFNQSLYSFNITENTAQGLTRHFVHAFDQDTGINQAVHYLRIQKIPEQADLDWFTVQNTTGAIQILKPPDRETCSKVTLIIKAYQTDKPSSRYDKTVVEINIVDVDDNPPILSQSLYNITVPENLQTDNIILQVIATDKDQGNNSRFSFHFLVSGRTQDTCNGMVIDGDTGIIKVQSNTEFDREKHRVLNCKIVAKGDYGSKLQSNSSDIIIDLLDENDNNPEFNQTSYSFNISKTHGINAAVGKVTATDKDTPPLTFITYSTKDTTFHVNSKTGTITLVKDLREVFNPVYSFEVTVRDSSGNDARFGSTMVTVQVSDVNIHTPEFDQKEYHLSVYEDFNVDLNLLQIKATDKDPDDTLTYRISGGDNSHLFKINTASGVLSIATPLDYENSTNYRLTIGVSDSIHTNHTVVKVTVKDVNDNKPTFDQASYRFTNITENVNSIYIGTVHATDKDSGNNSVITYRIESPWSQNFTIDKNGLMRAKSLDREALGLSDEIKLVVIVTDQGHPPLTGTTEVIVTVGDVNDNCPYYDTEDSKFTYIFKEYKQPHNFHDIWVRDDDATDNGKRNTPTFDPPLANLGLDLKVDAPGGHVNHVYLNATKPFIRTSDTGIKHLHVSWKSAIPCPGNHMANQTVTIIIQDVNDHSPVFSPASYSFTVKEDLSEGQKVNNIRINATDLDPTPEFNTVHFSIRSGNDAGHFRIDEYTGDIYVVKRLDYEKEKSYKLIISATDGKPFYNTPSSPPKVTTATVQIGVIDVNDNAPKFNKDLYNCTVNENSTGPIPGCSVSADDSDSGVNGNFTYKSLDKAFTVSPSGEITIVGRTGLDYDDGPHQYKVEVLAVDNGTPKLTGTTIVDVTVVNINDNPPVFAKNYTFSVMEDATLHSIVGMVKATDKDGDILKYSTVSTDFEMSPDGVLTVKSSLLDKTTFSLTVLANDTNQTAVTMVTVNIVDVNNHPPEFEKSTYSCSFNETDHPLEIIQVKATDKDSALENRNISYSLVQSLWSHNFTVDKNGLIRADSLDREALGLSDEIKLIVMATDQGHPPLTGTTEVIITVGDVNDNCPYYDTEDSKFTYIFKEHEQPIHFHDILVKDDDASDEGKKNQLKYDPPLNDLGITFDVIETGTHVNHVYLNATAPFKRTDESEIKQLHVSWRSLDLCPGNHTANQTVTIIIQDVNDHSPVFSPSSYSFTVKEDLSEGQKVNNVRINATDLDPTPEFNTVHYNIRSGNDAGHFRIDELTGDIYIVKKMDYEKEKSYKLVIVATDGKPFYNTLSSPPKTSTATVDITVTDVNDNAPKFNKDLYECSVNENSTGLIPSCIVSADDSDSGVNGNFTFKSSDENFSVDKDGHVRVISALDYESGVTEYIVQVIATDKGSPPLKSSTLVIVKVNNTNDNLPEFDARYSFNLTENKPVGSILGLVRATDLDGDKLTFTLLNNTADFRISSNGLLSSAKEIDYEIPPNMYHVGVQVSDGVHNITTSISVTIKNINDNQPVFSKPVYVVNVKETVTKTTVKVLNVSDADNLGSLTYQITGGGGDCSDIFTIDQRSGALTIDNTRRCLDYDRTQSYSLLIQVNDELPFKHFSQAMIHINVTDEDTKPPKFIWPRFTATIKEDFPIGHSIVEVGATDPDTSIDSLTYNVLTYTSEFVFSRNNLLSNALFDIERQTNYTVNISVTDTGGRIDYAVVEIQLEDVNDNDPTFVISSLNYSIPANAVGNRSIGIIKAEDKDVSNQGFTFYLPHEDHFWINSNTGELHVMDGHGTSQFAANMTYKVKVVVMDQGQPPRSSSTDVDIFIDITNHYPPEFIPLSNIGLPENMTLNSTVATVKAKDKDPKEAGMVYYKLISNPLYDGKFKINQTTGEITLNGTLNFEEKPHYELTVLAIDKADDPKTGTAHVWISITDVNEKPLFLEKLDGLCIKSPIAGNQLVAIVSAEDPDRNESLTYSLQDHTNFVINSNSGQITARKNLTGENFTITVIVTDKGGLTDTKRIVLNNNPSLVITPAIITVKVPENSTNLTITQVKALSNNTLTYSLFNSTGFSIDNNGVITSNGPLDREKGSPMIVHVMVNSSTSSCQAQVNIELTDINDNAPTFGFLYDVHSIPENFTQNTCFFPLPVEDPDLNTHLSFSIKSDNSGGKFTIQKYVNETGGCLELRTPLDYESMPPDLHGTYTLRAEVSDGIYSNSREIKVHVEDINDNNPVFNSTVYYAEVFENVPLHTSILSLEATDKDAIDDGKLTYSIAGADSGYFMISKGELKVEIVPDRENVSSYQITVVATDSAGHQGTTTVNITVLDVNDNTPKFNNSAYMFTHVEGPSSKGFQMRVFASDPDAGENGTVKFKLINYHGLFNVSTLSNNQGLITVLVELDRESPRVLKENGTAIYILHIEAHDMGKPQQSATTVVTLDITDINDCTPQFTLPQYNATVLEGSPKGFSILTVTTTDCDYEPEFTDIDLSLEGTDSDLFEIDHNGVIRLNTTISVKSHKDHFSLTIVANDSLNTNKVPLNIEIADVNDHDPKFTRLVYNFSTPETDGRTSSIVGMVSATDDDLGNNGVVTYSIISVDVQSLFNISQNGTIYTIGPLDRDQCISNRYPFTVIGVDQGLSQRTGYTEVIVYITDINDNSPVFTQGSYSGSVKENSGLDEGVNVVPPISATDIDSGISGTEGIRYSLVGYNLPFSIDERTGQVLTNTTDLDRETQAQYVLQVRAADRNGTGHVTFVNLTIDLIDVNDEPPTFSSDNYTFSVNESAIAGQKVGVVIATDDDVNGNTTTRYRIASGSDGKFYVDILSGDVFTSGGLDRERKSSFKLSVEAFDGQQKTNSTVHILIEDSNDNSPVFEGTMKARVPEDTVNGTVVYNLTANDLDIGMNGQVSFSMNSSDPFKIVGDSVVLTGDLDRETKDQYNLEVTATDHGYPPRWSRAELELIVEDVNDHAPEFYNAEDKTISQATATIIEKSPVGTLILWPSVKDMDTGVNAEIEFTLVAPKLESYFEINGATGVVTIKAQVDLNSLNQLHILAENATQTAELNMTVVATDKGSPHRHTNLSLIVEVEGINDQAPVFLKPEYTVQIPETIPNGSIVETVKAIVQNGTGFRLQYSLIPYSGITKYFSVSKISGIITTVSRIDREETPSFHFPVQVKDGKTPERTAYTLVSIKVLDENDNHPKFTQRSYEYIIEENLPTPGIQLLATDPDSGENGTVSYHLFNNTDNQFVLDENSGMLTINGTLDREHQDSYNLTVMATDNGTSPLASTVQVVVIVTDQNDNKPEFTPMRGDCRIEENQPPTQSVCHIEAKDPDFGVNGSIIYKFSGSMYPQFDIDPTSGNISTLESLDFEQQAEYNLTITAMDLGTPALSSIIVVPFKVIDVYDTAPSFSQDVYEITLDVNTQPSTTVTMVNAGLYNIHYKIEDGNNGNHFEVNATSGAITLVSSLGTSVLEYKLNVSASDGISLDYTQVLIHVTTGAVQRQNNTFTATILENLNISKLLIDLNYTDGSNTQFEYHLINIIPAIESTFRLDQASGKLFCDKQLDREETNQYILHVRALPIYTRVKRSIGDSQGDMKVIVNVQDENDNAPTFYGAQVVPVGIPDTTAIGDIVTTIKADDPDLYSTIQYSITGGSDKDSFDIGSDTGKIYSRVKVKPGKSYTIAVTAYDGKFSTQINIVFLVVSNSNKALMTLPIPTSEFEANNVTILRNISSIVGFKVEMEKYRVHVDPKTLAVDISKTDVFFHGINVTNGVGSLLPQEKVVGIVTTKTKEIESLFYPKKITIVPYHTALVPQKMSVAEIALLVIGVFMFVSCLVALLVANYTWKQFKASQKKLSDKMWELNSIHSTQMNGSVRNGDIGMVNPAFTTSEQQVSPVSISDQEPPKQEYESQEVVLDLPIEPLEAMVPQPVNNGAREMSLGYDSGLENESNSTSSDDRGQAEVRDLRIETSVVEDEASGNIFRFDMETGDTDDDELSDGEGQNVTRRKSSKKKKPGDLKIFPGPSQSIDTDTDEEAKTFNGGKSKTNDKTSKSEDTSSENKEQNHEEEEEVEITSF